MVSALDLRFLFSFTGISSKVAVTPSSLKATFGDTSRFFCSIKHSSPKAIIAWRKQGSSVLITTGERFTLTPDGALQIRNIRFEEQGKYECVARNTITMRMHTSTTAGTLQVIPGMFWIVESQIAVSHVTEQLVTDPGNSNTAYFGWRKRRLEGQCFLAHATPCF